ncbi:TPA: helix-turn-helix transcriptional regulator, partial [Klebsiella quasipneumoniae]|nr:helix-turn-helix transcriptional regulator [Klebsiella quasipneumoniae]
MTNFLINIKNHYLRVAIAELVIDSTGLKVFGE